MKKIVITFMFAAMLILTACGNKTEAVSPTARAEQMQQIQPVQKVQEEQITEADAQSVIQPLGSYYQDYVSRDREGDIEYDLPADYRLPRLNMEGKIAEEFQAWTDALLAGFPRTLDYYVNRWDMEEMHIDYRCGISDDILTVTIGLNGHPFDCWPDAPESFTIDLRTGQQLTLDGFVERYGTWEQLEDFLAGYIFEHFPYSAENIPQNCDPAEFTKAHEKLLSAENLKQSTITLDACDERFPIVIRVPNSYVVDIYGRLTQFDSSILYVRACNVEEIFGK